MTIEASPKFSNNFEPNYKNEMKNDEIKDN